MEQVQKDKKPIYKKWWFWVIGVVAFFFVIGMFAGDEETPTTQTQQAVQSEQETESEPQQQAEWVKVIELTANANRQSDTFTLSGGQQRVAYSVSGGDFGMCSIYVLREGQSLMRDGGFPVVMAEGGLTDETMMRQSRGDYYLDVQVANATCDIEIYERR